MKTLKIVNKKNTAMLNMSLPDAYENSPEQLYVAASDVLTSWAEMFGFHTSQMGCVSQNENLIYIYMDVWDNDAQYRDSLHFEVQYSETA